MVTMVIMVMGIIITEAAATEDMEDMEWHWEWGS